MNNLNSHNVPLSAVTTGRSLGDVLSAYTGFFNRARECATARTKDDDKLFAEATTGAVYRLYLLGVEDGMNGGKK